MALEAMADGGDKTACFDGPLTETKNGTVLMDPRAIIRTLLEGLEANRPVADLASAFHNTLALMLADCVRTVSERTGLRRVVLSGGCFVNRLLLTRLHTLLREEAMEVYIHHQVPPGDGGVSLGQAVAAAARLSRGFL